MSAVCSPGPPRYAQESPTLTCDQIAQGFRYDPASQVTQILHQLGASGPTINQAAYAYNGVGNRTSVTDRRGSQNFGYDNLDRLTSASHPLLGTAQAFAYDAVGNRTTAGNVTNAGNQLTADATHSYQYDDNGNLTRKTLLAVIGSDLVLCMESAVVCQAWLAPFVSNMLVRSTTSPREATPGKISFWMTTTGSGSWACSIASSPAFICCSTPTA